MFQTYWPDMIELMIEALCEYYDVLEEEGDPNLAKWGHSKEKVSFSLNISSDGDLLNRGPSVGRRKKTETEGDGDTFPSGKNIGSPSLLFMR